MSFGVRTLGTFGLSICLLWSAAASAATTQLQGAIEVHVIDVAPPAAPKEVRYLRIVAGGRIKRYRLEPGSALAATQLPRAMSSADVRGDIVPPAAGQSEPVLKFLEVRSMGTPDPPSGVTGTRSIAVVHVRFATQANSCSIDELRTAALDAPDSTAAQFQASSYSKLKIRGEVLGTIQIPTPTSCNYMLVSQQVDEQLTAQGVSLARFDSVAYSIPNMVGCTWLGIGYMPGNRTWIKGCNGSVLAHELGHNFGFHHAASFLPTGQMVEYGDGSDIMGAGTRPKGHNAPHKIQAGWLPDSVLAEVGETSTLDFAPLHTDPAAAAANSQILAAKIRIPASQDQFWLSYRRSAGIDSIVAPDYTPKLAIHTHSAPGVGRFTFLYASLAAGQSWTAPGGGLRIEVLSLNANSLKARVTYNCTPTPPFLIASPLEGAMGPSGMYDPYVVINNADGLGCTRARFELRFEATAPLQALLGSGAESTQGVHVVEMEPSSSLVIPASVRTTAASVEGKADFKFSASRLDADVPSMARTGTLLVDLLPPSVPTGLTAAPSPGAHGEYDLAWTASLDAASGVAFYQILNRGSVIANVPNPRAHVFLPVASGAILSVRAVDQVGNLSEPSKSVVP